MHTLVFLEGNFSREAIEGDVAWDSPVQVGSQRQQVAPSTKLGPKLHATPRQKEQNILLADFIYLSLELLLACHGFFCLCCPCIISRSAFARPSPLDRWTVSKADKN